MIRHFTRCSDFDHATAAAVFDHARALKANRAAHRSFSGPLDGQTWAMLFHKSSTRTRVSFEVGIRELGGHPMVLDPGSLQMGRGETVEDTARVLSRYVHGIIIRTYQQQLLEQFAAAGSIPVVNALTDQLHPCQIYTDGFTLAERWASAGQPLLDSLRGRSVLFVGDCASNMAHSWILGGALFGMEVRLAGPAAYAPEPWINELLAKAGLPRTYTFSADLHTAARGVDCVYTDVWVSMGDEAEKAQRLRDFAPYQVDANVMAAAAPGCWFLHCLPAHEGEEVSADVYRSAQSIVFDQAENRLHMQKAILSQLAAH
jgi:ornithine carbamoyltransferase